VWWLVGFLLFDFWIVDASIARTGFLVAAHPAVWWGVLLDWGAFGVGVVFCSVCLCCFC
jgi:hypothetical protein